MPGVSRTRPVDTLLSRFGAAHTESTEMEAAVVAPQPENARELIPRLASLQETRSQTERRARADVGDLQARLDPIPLNVVEDQLSRCVRAAQPECSILDCLRGRGEAVAGHQDASFVLEELADSTEQAAFTSALVHRYIQAHALLKGHPDSNVTSAEAFLDTLDISDHVKANIVIGSSADLSNTWLVRYVCRLL
ncbi:hypothetical protein LTR12_016197 [Friedmanniomyces endolithicus]|nr:hypothetical protein LTR74_018143 [Friedmanniomyces endolithicus]KAK1809435.1 hypothetical protein LTR12_016197 [Friedmanniomyces endolithicus]